jgi:hypothetical protein
MYTTGEATFLAERPSFIYFRAINL